MGVCVEACGRVEGRAGPDEFAHRTSMMLHVHCEPSAWPMSFLRQCMVLRRTVAHGGLCQRRACFIAIVSLWVAEEEVKSMSLVSNRPFGGNPVRFDWPSIPRPWPRLHTVHTIALGGSSTSPVTFSSIHCRPSLWW